jgi:hypothetical protein
MSPVYMPLDKSGPLVVMFERSGAQPQIFYAEGSQDALLLAVTLLIDSAPFTFG